MKIADIKNKRVLVVGLGVTGWSVVRYLRQHNIEFDVADENADKSELSATDSVLYSQFNETLFCSYDILVLSPGIPRAHPSIVAALHSGVAVIGDIELFADDVKVPVVAVTGSNGKSTVVAWLVNTLQACGVKTVACGNIGAPALDSLQADIDLFVLELSSYQLESTESLKPLSATVLNISEDHLDRYQSIEHYASVKRRVYLNAEHCIVNRDDARTWPVRSQHSAAQSTLENPRCASCYYFTLGNTTADSNNDLGRTELNGISVKLPGEHNLANALAVIALAEPLDVSRGEILNALPLFSGLEHRNEFVAEKSGVRWYNDSKGTNVDACKNAVLAMPGPVILIAGGISKGADFSLLIDVVKRYVKLLILMGRDRHTMAEFLAECTETVLCDSLMHAVGIANERATGGDAVLLSPACSSFDMFRNFEDRGNQYKIAVSEVLAA